MDSLQPVLMIDNETMVNATSYGPFDERLMRLQQPWRLDLGDHPKYPAFGFEKLDHIYWRQFVWEHPMYPYVACVLYLATIFGIQHYMKDRAPLKLKTPLVIWNWALAIFSIMGFYRLGQELGDLVFGQENGLHKSICEVQGHYIPAAFWGLLFTFSKYIELGDTVFIALRKQPLLALQWYHHCLVTVFAWVLYSWQEPILRVYAVMNYGAHSIMYPYFALRGMNIKVPEIFAMLITTIQVMQMIAGVSMNAYSLYVWGKGEECSRNPYSIAFSLFTYFSLWIMFIQFFVAKYISRTRKKNKAE
ncbi:unnamed protein product [Orchesella dallaii]|uniref:Elongation of very long chain fatty acids protein n=1 Tax=Orchesella dallaii TaxID=48710 RepID=A0ABP1PQF7_9HEXA